MTAAASVQALPMRRAEIDVAALRDNCAALVRHTGVAVMAMVKANGYGHGAAIAARAFVDGGATWLGVSSPEEALQLREAGLTVPILNVNWTNPAQVEPLIAAGVHMTVWDSVGVEAVIAGAERCGARAQVHLKADTGMGRLGARPEDVLELAHALVSSPHIELRGFFTHFADADADESSFAVTQHERFVELAAEVRRLQPDVLLHAANSAASLRLPDTYHDIVRPGIALYGYPPQPSPLQLQPALTLIASVTQVKTVQPGDTVGYGRTWRAERPTRVATIGAGYADGVHRVLSNRGTVLVHGVRCPMIGRVSMDQLGVDVSAVPEVRPGDDAVLIGRSGSDFLGADEVGTAAGTISYEVLCAVSARVTRIAV